ncbi:MAG TPA: phytase, partial [Acidimicrobiales bacterium]
MRARRVPVLITTLAVLAGVTVAVWPQMAGATAAYQNVPQASWGTNGSNTAVAIANGRVFVGGTFGSATNGTTSELHNNLAAFDESSGEVIHTWNASTDGPVEALAVYGDSLYVAGTFTTVDGQPRKNMAKIVLADGTLDPAFNPAPNNTVYDLWVKDTTLYLVGDFNTVAGQSRVRIAALNLNTTGSLVLGFAPSANRRVSSVATSPDGSKVYVGGRFSTINGQAADYLAAVNASNGAWDGVDFSGVEPPDPTTQTSNILDLAASASQVFVAIGGQHFNVVGAWGTNGVRAWWHGVDATDHLDGDVQGLVLDGKWLYFCFHGGYNGDTKLRIFAADTTTPTGLIDADFRPVTNGVAGMESVTTDGTKLVAVGDFSTSGGVPLKGVALFPAVGGGGGTTTSPPTSPTTPPTTPPSTPPTTPPTTPPSTPPTTPPPPPTTATPPTTPPTTPPGGTKTVSPSVATPDRKPSGTIDADDAAVWNKGNPATAVILGTIKEGGLDVYKPDGTVVQSIAGNGGRFNNVDLVYDVTLGGQTRDLAV